MYQCNKHAWDLLYCLAPTNNIDLRVESLFLPTDQRVCLQCGKVGYLVGILGKEGIFRAEFKLEELIKARDWAKRCNNLYHSKRLNEHIQTLTEHEAQAPSFRYGDKPISDFSHP